MPGMKARLVGTLVVAVGALASLRVEATCGGGGGGGMGGMAPGGGAGSSAAPRVYQVPWKFVGPDQPAPAQGLILYWFPASLKEAKESALVTSRDLSLYSAQCVETWVAGSDTALGEKLGASGKQPAVVLTDAVGTILGRVDNEAGALSVSAVEHLVRDELKKRDDSLKQQLNDAETKTKSGDNQTAVAMLKAVWDQRCLFPKKAKDAARQLKKLGSPVDENPSALAPIEPMHEGPRAALVLDTMQRGLAAEQAGHYDEARALYARAHHLDAGDPVPARYLAELYRHHTGQWAKARRMFEAMLTRPIDPVSRAVALHGLGKMMIHEGKFAQGLSLMEESVRVHPLPLAYRNLAVYWNSEGNPEKTAEYVGKALALAPEDPYNRIFAAVFWAASGRVDEATKLAADNEALLPASYNLAAIYAQAGQRDHALALLRRHFYEYERYKAVRGEEMMEARVDAVFGSLRKDPEFLALTALADGKLRMPMMTAH
jgi:tetratricopeptide (TPR) repeat protein